MKKPSNLKTFLENNQSRTFYVVKACGGYGSISPVTPACVYDSSMGWAFPNEPGTALLSFSSIYETREEAEQYVKTYLDICKRFDKLPSIDPDVALPYGDKLLEAERTINKALASHSNFDGVDFVEDYQGAVRIRTFHKSFPDYSFGVQAYIEPDFSNLDKAVVFAIDQFKANDTDRIKSLFQRFTAANDLGWD